MTPKMLLGRVVGLSVVLLLVLGRMAAAGKSAVEITDDLGHHIALAAPPRRIVALLPSLTETVCVLGGCSRLVGTDRYSNWPNEARALPKLGGLDDTSLEAIVALHPDVVLAARSARVIERLEELGVPVVVLESTSLEGSRRVMLSVARLLGDPDRGETAWKAVESRIAKAAGLVPAACRGKRIYFEVGEGPYAASSSSFIGEILDRLGLANVVPASLGPFPRLTPEYVVRANPDIIMSGARELSAMSARPGWNALVALRNGQDCGFKVESMDVIVRPGPRLGEAAEIMARCLVALAPAAPS